MTRRKFSLIIAIIAFVFAASIVAVLIVRERQLSEIRHWVNASIRWNSEEIQVAQYAVDGHNFTIRNDKFSVAGKRVFVVEPGSVRVYSSEDVIKALSSVRFLVNGWP